MKLGELNSAIRKMKGAPMCNLRYHPEGESEPVELTGLEITKQSLLNALKVEFPDKPRNTETGLMLKADGFIIADDNQDHSVEASADEQSTDIDDILG